MNNTKRDALGNQVSANTKANDYSKYYNSPAMSDITILYSGRVFRGHKVILANGASWFENAFKENRWLESDAKEITLEDDDPEALEGMFAFMYNIDSETSAKGTLVEEAILSVKLLGVADKYQCAGLIEAAPSMFLLRLDKVLHEMGGLWMRHMTEGDEERAAAEPGEMLTRVAEAVYDFQKYWARKDKSPITEHLLTTMFEYNEITPFDDHSSQEKALQIAAQEVAPFGRDLFLGMTERRGRDSSSHPKAGWRHCYLWPCLRCKKRHLSHHIHKRFCKDCIRDVMMSDQ